MSPRRLPPSTGGASPRRRWSVPGLVPGATRSRLVPCSVGTSTSAPPIASATVIGTSTSTLSPLRVNTGESCTWVTTYRPPDGPPRSPASPLPASRIREPSLTPGGMFTRYFLSSRSRPWPPQVGHGSSMTVPEPPQRAHGRVIENRPWPWDSTPRPWHTGQTTGEVPGRAPVPRQVVHGAWVETWTGICAPSTACSKDSETLVSRSRPRSATGFVRAPPPRPAVVEKMFERMSEKDPKSWPAGPPAPPGAPVNPPPNRPPPRSYVLRFSGSPRTSYASEICLKRSSAPVSLLVSGWYWRASLRYAFLISSGVALRSTPRTL